MAERLDLVITGGTLVTSGGRRAADLGVVGELIAVIGEPGSLGDADEVLDASGLLVLPGVIDSHVHFRQPGLEHEEDWASGSLAAVHGGVTTVLEMPNTVPPTATVASARDKLALAEASSHCDFGIFGLLGDNSAHVAELAASGLVVGLKAFLGPTTGEIASSTDDALRAGLAAAKAAGLRTVFHAEDAAIVASATASVRSAGRDDARAHMDARPVEAEVVAIERVGRLLVETGAAGHVAHLTSAQGLAAVEGWRAAGADLTAELTPHHALLGLDAYDSAGGLAKVNPPIRGEPHASALLAALASGRIDCLASDHAPHTLAAKQRASVWDAAAGFCGVETLLPLLLTQVAAGRLAIEALVRATSEGPARVWRLWPRKGALVVGADADLTIVDAARRAVIQGAALHGRNNDGPWEGWPTAGAPVATIVRGTAVMRDGELVGPAGWGQPVAWAASGRRA